MGDVLTRDAKVALIASYASKPEKIVNLLFRLQRTSKQHYIDQKTAQLVSDHLKIPVSGVYELCSYYPILNVKPQAKYVLKLCNAAPCTLVGGEMIRQTLEAVLGVPEDTVTEDGLFAYKSVGGLGACDQAPFIKVGTKVFGHLDETKTKQLVHDLQIGHYDHEI